MALIVRPTKTGGNTQYTQEVAAGFKIIRAAEVDADLNLLYQTVNGGLDGANLVDGSVGTAELAANSVTTDKIAPGAVGTSDLGNGAVTNEKLASNAVTWEKIANNSINTAHLVDNAVTWNKIAPGSINTANLVDNAVTWDKIAPGSINTAHLVDGAVTAAKIADGTITAAELAPGAVSGASIAANSIGADQLVDTAFVTSINNLSLFASVQAINAVTGVNPFTLTPDFEHTVVGWDMPGRGGPIFVVAVLMLDTLGDGVSGAHLHGRLRVGGTAGQADGSEVRHQDMQFSYQGITESAVFGVPITFCLLYTAYAQPAGNYRIQATIQQTNTLPTFSASLRSAVLLACEQA
jgi:hypothetical protein